jgi:WD40 repeat protein
MVEGIHQQLQALTCLSASLRWQVWNTYTGEDMFTLEGHKNVVSAVSSSVQHPQHFEQTGVADLLTSQHRSCTMGGSCCTSALLSRSRWPWCSPAECVPQVYAIAFNNPYGDKVVTGSFDKTAKL